MSVHAARSTRPLMLASAGIGVVGASFGMARYGFGLLAPDIRASFQLTNSAIGLLAAASYVAYLATSVAAAMLSDRLGARKVVAAGGFCAVSGMVLAGTAATAGQLFAGLLVAGASAGLVFPPFSDVVSGSLAPDRRERVLAAISSGTGWGVALAVPLALLAGENWRTAWLLFAVAAALATGWALAVLPVVDRPAARGATVQLRPRWFVCPRSAPLLAGALFIGVASSTYWTFAVEHLQSHGGLSSANSRIVLAVVGLASIVGTASADMVRHLGARTAFTVAAVVEAVSLILLGLFPGTLAVALASAALFGAAYNTVIAVQVMWSARVYAARPSAGLAAVMVMGALGLLTGPPVLGAVADRTGLAAVFVAGAVLLILTIGLAPRGPWGRQPVNPVEPTTASRAKP